MQIGVLTAAPIRDASSSRYASYIKEILDHAGLPWTALDGADLMSGLEDVAVLILPAQQSLSHAQETEISRFIEAGRVLVACGGSSGLDHLTGCRDQGALSEAWVRAVGCNAHQVTEGLAGCQPLHAFGGRQVQADVDVSVLAEWLAGYTGDDERQVTLGPAVTVRQAGTGYAVLIAADLVHSVVRIQQGRPVHVDGQPAADGSAPVNDGILKTDDGIILDYERDRMSLAGTHFFGCGMADQWRELLIRALLWGLQVTRTSVPMLWYWPDLIPAVGLLSHDTDGNDPALAELLLKNLQKLGIRSTWCLQYPGGYAPAFYRRLQSAGYEVALHYDAYTQRGRTYWREEDFRQQLDWLNDMAGTAIVSNKNHYLRWGGLDEFFCWLARAGIRADQTKGPSKTGNTGFPFGGCHPWFPVHEHTMQMIDVLEINLATQDLYHTCPPEIGSAVIDWALANHGVAHFLFHPAHAAKPMVAEAMSAVVAYGQARGLPWWTSDQIQSWERKRRRVRLRPTKFAGGHVWTVTGEHDLPGATLLWFGADPLRVAGSQRIGKINVYGRTAQGLVLDLAAGQTVTLSTP